MHSFWHTFKSMARMYVL